MIYGFPKEVRTSWIARAKWCNYESKIRATTAWIRRKLKPIEEKLKEGYLTHQRLEAGRVSKETEQLMNAIRESEPIYRKIHGVRVYAHPDRIVVTKKGVMFIEYKTTKLKPTNFQIYPAQMQLEIYLYVFKPLLKKLGFKLAPKHKILFYTRGKKPRRLAQVFVSLDETRLLDEIKFIFDMWRGKAKPIPPAIWKCRLCRKQNPLYYKVCPWYARLKREGRL